MVTATAFQILVNNAPIKPVTDSSVVTLEVSQLICDQPSVLHRVTGDVLFQGVLPGAGEDLPTIVIAAHYDSYGLAPVSNTKTNFSHIKIISKALPCRSSCVRICVQHSGCRTEQTLMAAGSPSF